MTTLVDMVNEATGSARPGTLDALDRERLLAVARTLTLMAEPGWLPDDIDEARRAVVVDYVLVRVGEIERLLGTAQLTPTAARILRRAKGLSETKPPRG